MNEQELKDEIDRLKEQLTYAETPGECKAIMLQIEEATTDLEALNDDSDFDLIPEDDDADDDADDFGGDDFSPNNYRSDFDDESNLEKD